jgi:hypothetical protein
MAAIEQAAEDIFITDPVAIGMSTRPSNGSRFRARTRSESLVPEVGRPPRFYEQFATIKAGRAWRGRIINKRKDGS